MPDFTLADRALMGAELKSEEERIQQYDRAWGYFEEGYDTLLPTTTGAGTAERGDNIKNNMCSTLVDKSLDFMYGAGIDPSQLEIEVDETPEGPEEEYLNQVLKQNNRYKLLRSFGLHAALTGTGYIKIVAPPAVPIVRGAFTGDVLPRLIALDSREVCVMSDEQDVDFVREYRIQWTSTMDGKPVVRRQRYIRQGDGEQWAIREEVYKQAIFSQTWGLLVMTDSARWELTAPVQMWPWPWCPIVAAQNMVEPNSFYGRPDLTPDVLSLQEAINRSETNIMRIITFHAHPQTVAEGVRFKDGARTGPGKLLEVPRGSKIYNVEMQSDLSAAQNFDKLLRDAFWALGRTPDPQAVASLSGDRVTNYRILVLFADLIAKTYQKRQLQGRALEQLCERLLDMRGM